MNKIKVMSFDLASKIAAGEVVENQSSVVKELVENALDAHATKIDIHLINHGVQLIEVIDNGDGMSKEDILLSSKEHATSKLTSEYDLFNIDTLGFRGEALASIKSVSKLVISSNNGQEGYTYDVFEDKIEPCYSNKGTKISVYNLFYNVPARFKYLQSFKKELSKVVELVNKFALTYPNVSFTLTNDQNILFSSNGNNDILQVINNIYSIDIVKGLEAFQAQSDDFKITGYLSNKDTTRSNRNHINVYINHRLVFNKELINAVIDGYDDYLMERRYPIVFLNIQCDYQLIDVNVHPAKLEVRISKLNQLLELITNSIKAHFSIKRKDFFIKDKIEQPSLDFTYTIKEEVKPYVFEEVIDTKSEIGVEEDLPIIEQTIIEQPRIDKPTIIEPVKVESKIHLIALAQYNNTYILASSMKGLHLIDQHAAAERINYEKKLTTHYDLTQEDLLIPISISLSKSEKLKIEESLSLLESVGLYYEDSANDDLIFRCIPRWMDIEQATSQLTQAINFLIDNKSLSINQINKDSLIMASCKMSLKANARLSLEAQQSLLDQLVLCDNYDHCPHGRPIIVTLSNYDIEKLFKRVV